MSESRTLGSDVLGVKLGERMTLVQFSSSFCQPCRATRAVLRTAAAEHLDVVHVEIDAESHLDLVRSLDIRRTPTTVVLDAAGRIKHQISGAPRLADARRLVGQAQ